MTLVARIFGPERENQVLAVAIAGSLLLHLALLLLPAFRAAQERGTREPIVARLVVLAAEPAPVAPPSAAPVAEVKKLPAESGAHAPVRAKPKPALKPRPAPALERKAPNAETADADIPNAASATSAQPGPVAIQPQPAPVASDGPDTGTLAQYRLAVISAARQYKRYPRVALENDWQGKVEVRMGIAADGSIASLAVRSSTGHTLLDQQALEMIERAKALALIPPALRGKQFVVDIAVEFALRKPGA